MDPKFPDPGDKNVFLPLGTGRIENEVCFIHIFLSRENGVVGQSELPASTVFSNSCSLR